MAYDLRYPMITGASEKEQLIQMKSYLHQLVEQLNYSLNNIDTVQIKYISSPKSESSKKADDKGTQATFNDLKPLIIKSAEIVNSYYKVINERLEGIYVAQSDFGTFVEQTAQDITKNSTDITQAFTNIQSIESEINYTQRDIISINSNIENIDSNIVSLGGSVSELDDEIKIVEENVGAIDSELKTVEGNVQTIATDVETLDTSIADVDKSVQSVDKNLWQLDSKIDDAKTGIGASLGALSSDLGKLDSGVKEIKDAVGSELQSIKDEIEAIVYSIIEVNASIKSGLLYYDENEIPIYGLEVGQRNIIDGVEVFRKYARFTANRLSFYDQNDIEVAYISDNMLYINNVEVTTSYKIGGFVDTVMSNGDVVERWVGRG